MYKKVLAFIILLAAGPEAFGQTTERVYLQSDKNSYIAGEILWFKVITTDERGCPQDFSKVAYVELMNGSGTAAQTKIEIAGCTGSGSLVIPPQVKTGIYRLVAYTRYMQNEGDKVFFESLIAVVNSRESGADESESMEEFMKRYESAPHAATGQVVKPRQAGIAASTDKNDYRPREKVTLQVSGLPEDVHTLSIAVSGDNYLKHELGRGITQWSLASPAETGGSGVGEIAEYEGHIVKGVLTDQVTGQAPDFSSVEPMLSFTGGSVKVFPGKVMQGGEILFPTQNINGARGITLSVKGDNASRYKVSLRSPYYEEHSEVALPGIFSNDVYNEAVLAQSISVQVMYAYNNDTLNTFRESIPLFNRKPDKVYIMEEYTKFATMDEVITEFVYEARFRRINSKRFLTFTAKPEYPEDILVMIDGIPVYDHEIIFNYNPMLLERIEVYRYNMLLGGRRYQGLIHFLTPKRNHPELRPDPSTVFFDYEGTQAQRLFFSPVYGEGKESGILDFRHTLYWNPDVAIEEGKNTAAIDFYTSDLPGNYKVTVEGVTESGEVLAASVNFKVD